MGDTSGLGAVALALIITLGLFGVLYEVLWWAQWIRDRLR